MKKMPYGISDYELLKTEDYYYVDKTMYLHALEDIGRVLTYLRPRRFGKTLFASMMYYYYDINSKDKFDKLFKDTYVYDNPTKNKNNYYVLRLDFSGLNSARKDDIRKEFAKKIIDGIKKFNYNYELNAKVEYEELIPTDVLSDFISYFRDCRLEHKLYIIIDEYDNFTNSILEDNADNFKEIVGKNGFIKDFYARIKEYCTNDVIDRVFITGVCSITLDSMTSGFNITTNITTDHRFNSMLGLTEKEVKELLKEVPKNKQEEIYSVLKNNYDGYLFNRINKESVFNSTLVMYFIKYYYENKEYPEELLDNNIISNYEQLGNIIKLQNNNYYKEVIDSILKTKEISGKLTVNFSLDTKLKKNDIISLLYYFGYLTINKEDMSGDLVFRVPNNVMNDVYNEYFLSLLSDINIEIEDKLLREAVNEMIQFGSIDKLTNYVTEILKKSDNRMFMKFDEKYIQATYFALLQQYKKFKIYNEYACSNGYIDLMLFKNSEICKNNIMLEFKYIKQRDYSKSLFNKIKEEGTNQLKEYAKDERIDDSTRKYLLIYVGSKLKLLEEIK